MRLVSDKGSEFKLCASPLHDQSLTLENSTQRLSTIIWSLQLSHFSLSKLSVIESLIFSQFQLPSPKVGEFWLYNQQFGFISWEVVDSWGEIVGWNYTVRCGFFFITIAISWAYWMYAADSWQFLLINMTNYCNGFWSWLQTFHPNQSTLRQNGKQLPFGIWILTKLAGQNLWTL